MRVLLTLVIILFATDSAYAISCDLEGLETNLQKADYVFIGKRSGVRLISKDYSCAKSEIIIKTPIKNHNLKKKVIIYQASPFINDTGKCLSKNNSAYETQVDSPPVARVYLLKGDNFESSNKEDYSNAPIYYEQLCEENEFNLSVENLEILHKKLGYKHSE